MCNNFFRKSCILCSNVEKYGRARQATDDRIMLRGGGGGETAHIWVAGKPPKKKNQPLLYQN
jgi:hypothetical protein